jgi:predicted ATP-grasp superfamily ATP-dependent carboligase
MDFKFDVRDGLYKPLDVNTRVWAWIGLGAQTGHDFPWSAYLLATGHEVLSPARTRPGRWVYVSHNLLSVGQQLRREKKLDASAWRSLFMPSLSATFAWDDPLPGVAEFPVLVPRLFKRIKERFAAKLPKT